jgi:hypothetical protein
VPRCRSSPAGTCTGPCRRPPDPDPTGVDYLGLVAAAHDEEAGTGAKIDFTQLGKLPGSDPGPAGAAVSPAPWAAHFGLARTPVRQVHRGPGPVRPPGPRRGDRPDQLLRGGIRAGGGHGGRRGGKTVALRAAVSTLDPTRHQVIYIANPAFGSRGLYVTIVRALGARPRYLKAELMAQAGDLLAAETAERHRRVVLICDFTDRPGERPPRPASLLLAA